MIIKEVQEKWYNFNQPKNKKRILIIIGLILSVLYFPIISMPSYLTLLLAVIAFVSLAVSVKYYYAEYSVLLAFVALACYAVLNVFIFLFCIALATIFFFLIIYAVLERHRIKKIDIYANKIDVSGTRGYKPKTVITIKEDE